MKKQKLFQNLLLLACRGWGFLRGKGALRKTSEAVRVRSTKQVSCEA
ncbi:MULTISPECIES: hypothetical protein [unclassified Campylobacter]|nr:MULTISPECIES: hypothetical protein [unclassified Campylobacter]MDA3055624.1 hypothetical protein [Campylobacter sp. CN_NA1]MDA3064686.1 hypothetical protein [Campylobacter sp. CN_NE4]MDA3068490.1 hypothetical protein [Campylobacter sp. CN_NE3]MDA3082197.1 hypothetical protein [Campylobacter sp. CN_EL2]MDA3083832.1 hypothetical protein [Campylobacter sp. CN_NE1]